MSEPDLTASEIALLYRLERVDPRHSLDLDAIDRRVYDRMRRQSHTRELLRERVDRWGMISPAGREALAALDQGAT